MATAGPGPDFGVSHGGDNERPVSVPVSAKRSCSRPPLPVHWPLMQRAQRRHAIASPGPITSTFSSPSGPFKAMSFRSPGGSSPRCIASVVGLCP